MLTSFSNTADSSSSPQPDQPARKDHGDAKDSAGKSRGTSDHWNGSRAEKASVKTQESCRVDVDADVIAAAQIVQHRNNTSLSSPAASSPPAPACLSTASLSTASLRHALLRMGGKTAPPSNRTTPCHTRPAREGARDGGDELQSHLESPLSQHRGSDADTDGDADGDGFPARVLPEGLLKILLALKPSLAEQQKALHIQRAHAQAQAEIQPHAYR